MKRTLIITQLEASANLVLYNLQHNIIKDNYAADHGFTSWFEAAEKYIMPDTNYSWLPGYPYSKENWATDYEYLRELQQNVINDITILGEQVSNRNTTKAVADIQTFITFFTSYISHFPSGWLNEEIVEVDPIFRD